MYESTFRGDFARYFDSNVHQRQNEQAPGLRLGMVKRRETDCWPEGLLQILSLYNSCLRGVSSPNKVVSLRSQSALNATLTSSCSWSQATTVPWIMILLQRLCAILDVATVSAGGSILRVRLVRAIGLVVQFPECWVDVCRQHTMRSARRSGDEQILQW